MAAVLMLVGALASGVYMQQLNQRSLDLGRSIGSDDTDAVLSALREDIERIAGECLQRAVEARLGPEGSVEPQAMWALDREFNRLFGQALAENYTGRQLKGLAVSVSPEQLNLTAEPLFFQTMNRFGMAVDMAVPAALRTLGTVRVVLTAGNKAPETRSLPIDVQAVSWYPFALCQAQRMRRDCAGEGLVELFLREMLSGYIARSLPVLKQKWHKQVDSGSAQGDWGKLNFSGACSAAILCAMAMEERVLFHRSSAGCLTDNFNGNPRPFRVASSLPAFSFDEPSAPPWSDRPAEGELGIDVPDFTGPIPLYEGLDQDRRASLLSLFPSSSWRAGPEVTVAARTYAGEEVLTDVYVLEVQVHGTYLLTLSPEGAFGRSLTFEVPVHLDLLADGRWSESGSEYAEWGIHHCQIENMSLFNAELARPYSATADVRLEVQNSSGESTRYLARPFIAEVSVDGEPAGAFGNSRFQGPGGLIIQRLPTGPHRFDIALAYTDGGEAESGSADGSFTGPFGNLTVRTDGGAELSGFWAVVLPYIRDAPYELRAVRMLELFSRMAGYPMPEELSGRSDNSSESMQGLIAWTHRFRDYLVSGDLAGMPQEGYHEAMVSSVEMLLEIMVRIEGLVTGMEWEKAGKFARALSIGALNVTVKAFFEKVRKLDGLEIELESSFSKAAIKLVKEDGKRRWVLERPTAESYKWKYDPLEKGERLTLAFEGALDILFIVSAGCSIYKKYMDFQSSDGLSVSESIDLSLDVALLGLTMATMVAQTLAKGLFQGVSEAAAKAVKVAAEVAAFVTGVLSLVQMVKDEYENFQNDEAALAALFTGFDETTVMFYVTLVSTVVSCASMLAVAGAATGTLAAIAALAPFLGPIGAVVALVAFLIVIAYNHEAIGCYLARTATTEARDKMVSSMGSTMRKSVGTLASLNDYPVDSIMLESRTARGAAHMLGQMGAFMNDPSYSLRLQSLSARSYDMAWAKAHQALAARGLRFSLIALWKQANDLRDEDSVGNETQDRHHLTDEGTLGENDWYSEIRVTDPSRGWENHRLRDVEIEDYLLGLNASTAANVRTGYILTITKGGVASDGLQMWADTVARVGDMVTERQRRLVRAQAMQSYVQGIDDRSYRNDMGYLQLRMSPQYVRIRLNITAAGADNFWLFDGENLSVRSSVEAELDRPDAPFGLYLGEGKYRVRVVDTVPGTETAWDERRVNVHSYYSPKFCSETLSVIADSRPIYFTIDDRLNGTVNLTVVCKDGANGTRGTLLDHWLFNASTAPSDRFYIDDSWIPGFDFDDSALGESAEMRESLTFTISIQIGMDNGSDGSFECWESMSLPTAGIRNDHVAVMEAQEGKHDDQLGYKLTIYASQEMRLHEGTEGSFITTRYTYWDMVT